MEYFNSLKWLPAIAPVYFRQLQRKAIFNVGSGARWCNELADCQHDLLQRRICINVMLFTCYPEGHQ